MFSVHRHKDKRHYCADDIVFDPSDSDLDVTDIVHSVPPPAAAACSAPGANRRGTADASVTVPGLGVTSVYHKQKCISKGGQRCRLTRGTNVDCNPDHGRLVGFATLWLGCSGVMRHTMTMTMTMTHSEKSRINQMRAWPYRQECRDHGPTKKNLVLLVELARWQGVQVQTVERQDVLQQYLK